MEQPNCLKRRNFYGKTSLSWKIRLQRKEKEFQKNKVPVDFRPIIDGPPADWKCFYRQEEAFSFARSKAESLHVFAYESSTFVEQHGQRLYLVSSFPQFWHYYSQLPADKRHHYEVIPNGSVCRLYFDLEFLIPENPGKEGVQMTEVFIKYICGWLLKCFNISCSSREILQLEASTAEKFSRHLIFHLPSAVFHDNIQAGHFVQHCARAVWDLTINPTYCSTTGQDGNSSSNDENYCDQDKLSAKRGENVKIEHLTEQSRQESSQDELPAKRENHDDDGLAQKRKGQKKMSLTVEDLKHWGLTKDDVLELIVNDKHGRPTLFCDTGVYTKNRNFRLYLSCKLGKKNPLVIARENQYKPHVPETKLKHRYFMDSLVTNIEFNSSTRILRFEEHSSVKRSAMQTGNSKSEGGLQGYQASPYPELDTFITSQVQTGGVNGHIRQWAYFPQAEVMLYDIGRNRWCRNIGRAHKSNNIMMVADLKASVFYQKCHDPDCRAMAYKSPEMPIPKSVLPSHYMDDDMDDTAEDEVSDEALVNAATLLEQSAKEVEQYSSDCNTNYSANDSRGGCSKNSKSCTGGGLSFEDDIGDEERLQVTASPLEQSANEEEHERDKNSPVEQFKKGDRSTDGMSLTGGALPFDDGVEDEELLQVSMEAVQYEAGSREKRQHYRHDQNNESIEESRCDNSRDMTSCMDEGLQFEEDIGDEELLKTTASLLEESAYEVEYRSTKDSMIEQCCKDRTNTGDFDEDLGDKELLQVVVGGLSCEEDIGDEDLRQATEEAESSVMNW